MIPPKVIDFCQHKTTLSTELANNPTEAPSSVCKRLFETDLSTDVIERKEIPHGSKTASDAEQAAQCGNWAGAQPSELFLKIYHDVLLTLDNSPLANICSPPLIGNNGVCPLFILSGIPDIARHMSNLIARAEHEVFLATNFWMISEPSRLISNALLELSNRAGKEGTRRVVKVMYDRGSIKQFMNNHLAVSPDWYANSTGPIRLPHPDQIPNIDLEVQNYHRPPLGTFHAKFLVVDRRIAVVQSNNIQDNDNMELMVQLEGSVVDALYETALISWANAMEPPLPCISLPSAQEKGLSTWAGQMLWSESGDLKEEYEYTSTPTTDTSNALQQHTSSTPHYDVSLSQELLRSISTLRPSPSEDPLAAISRNLNTTLENKVQPSSSLLSKPPSSSAPFSPFNLIPPHSPFPIALTSRPPHSTPNFSSLHTPQNTSFLAALSHATSSVYIQSPDINAQALPPAILSACRRGIHVTLVYCLGYNDSGEMLPLQGGHNESFAHALFTQLEPQFHPHLDVYAYTAKDQDRPISNTFKKRSCHIKLMIVDDKVAILGSGNQDSQSWYHSCEVNVMLDSAFVVGKLRQAVREIQNTEVFGKCAKDGEFMGCWVDPEEKLAQGGMGPHAGRFSWLRGAVGAVQRVRGVGGF